VNIPVWWYAVLAMNCGFNHAIVEGLPAASDTQKLAGTGAIGQEKPQPRTIGVFSIGGGGGHTSNHLTP
jgi:hypothetical protein